MKQIQTRYLYSAITASVFFVLCYLILNLNIFITIILTALIYVGGIFLFKEKDIREFSEEYVNNYYFLASKTKNQTTNIKDEKIVKDVEEISELTNEILISLRQRPKKVEQVFDFFDYYLDATYKILYKYNLLIEKENKTEEDNNYIKEVPNYITNIKESFQKQLSNMQEAKMLDIDTEIKKKKKTIGFNKDEIEVGEKDE